LEHSSLAQRPTFAQAKNKSILKNLSPFYKSHNEEEVEREQSNKKNKMSNERLLSIINHKDEILQGRSSLSIMNQDQTVVQ